MLGMGLTDAQARELAREDFAAGRGPRAIFVALYWLLPVADAYITELRRLVRESAKKEG